MVEHGFLLSPSPHCPIVSVNDASPATVSHMGRRTIRGRGEKERREERRLRGKCVCERGKERQKGKETKIKLGRNSLPRESDNGAIIANPSLSLLQAYCSQSPGSFIIAHIEQSPSFLSLVSPQSSSAVLFLFSIPSRVFWSSEKCLFSS